MSDEQEFNLGVELSPEVQAFLEKTNTAKFEDPAQVLQMLVDFICSRPIPVEDARRALEQTFRNNENQLRVYLIGVAKDKIRRYMRYLKFADVCEDELFGDSGRIKGASTAEVIRAYALCQGYMTTDLDYIQRVQDMGLEIQKILGSMNKDVGSQLAIELGKIPEMSPESRGRVRDVIEHCVKLLKDKGEEEVIDADFKEESGSTEGDSK